MIEHGTPRRTGYGAARRTAGLTADERPMTVEDTAGNEDAGGDGAGAAHGHGDTADNDNDNDSNGDEDCDGDRQRRTLTATKDADGNGDAEAEAEAKPRGRSQTPTKEHAPNPTGASHRPPLGAAALRLRRTRLGGALGDRRLGGRTMATMGTPYTITRTTTIDAAPQVVRRHLVDFRRWVDWSPWEGLDPALTRTYSGPDTGVGSTYSWDGNKKAGAGTMRILRDDPGLVEVALAFTRPFAARNTVDFVLTPAGGGTSVEWVMHGELNLLMRLFSLVKSMDSMMGPDFERGLAALKRVAEDDASSGRSADGP